MRGLCSLCLVALTVTSSAIRAADPPASKLLFDSGREGYPRYRIPSLIVTPNGTALALVDSRRGLHSCRGRQSSAPCRLQDE